MVKPWLLWWVMPALLGALPVIERPVTDPDRVLSSEQTKAVSDELVRLRADTGTQMAVLLVGSTGGEPIEDYAMRVAQAWRGGKAGEDKGLLLVVALQDRRMRLDVGYGLEAELPDDVVRRLLDEQTPLMRQRDHASALLRIVQGIHARLTTEGVTGTDPVPVETAPVAEAPVVLGSAGFDLAHAFRALMQAALCLLVLICVTHHPELVKRVGEGPRLAIAWTGAGLILGFAIYSVWDADAPTAELMFSFCVLCTLLLVGRRLLFAGGHARWGLAFILGPLVGGFFTSTLETLPVFDQIWRASEYSLWIGLVVLIGTFHDISNIVFSGVIFLLTGKEGFNSWRRAPSQGFSFTASSSSGSSSRSRSSSRGSSSSGGSWGGGGGGFGGGGASSSW